MRWHLSLNSIYPSQNDTNYSETLRMGGWIVLLVALQNLKDPAAHFLIHDIPEHVCILR